MNIDSILNSYNKTFSEIKDNYSTDFDNIYQKNLDWLCDLDKKTNYLNKLKSKNEIIEIFDFIKDVNYEFSHKNIDNLSKFISEIDRIVNVADRINNFKNKTILENGLELDLALLFNEVKKTKSLSDFNLVLNKNLKSFLPHLFSIIKHIQYPNEYPIYYKFWKNIIREVFNKQDDYDSICIFYRLIPININRHLNFGAYLGCIGKNIGTELNNAQLIKEKDDKEYKYIKEKVLNIDTYFNEIKNYTGYVELNTFENVLSKFEKDKLDVFFTFLKSIISKYDIQKGDERVVFSVVDNQLNFTIGQRYCFGLKKVNSITQFRVISTSAISEIIENFDGTPIAVFNTLTNLDLSQIQLDKVYKAIENQLNKTNKSGYLKNNNTDFEKYVFGMENESIKTNTKDNFWSVIERTLEKAGVPLTAEEIWSKAHELNTLGNFKTEGKTPWATIAAYCYTAINSGKDKSNVIQVGKNPPKFFLRKLLEKLNLRYDEETNSLIEITHLPINHPLNTILYGPPGTGKTHLTLLRASEIVENRKIETYSEAQQIFNTHLGDQIEFITFHQNYSYEDFIQGLRPDVLNEGNLSFEKRDGVFKQIADRALKNLLESEKPGSIKKDFDVVFNELIKPLSLGEVDEIEIPMKKASFYINSITTKSIEFRKNEGDSKHTLSIESLRKMYLNGSNELIVGGLQPYYSPLLNILLEKGKANGGFDRVKKQNYVIIIDEINRANISRVFGELITLIEPDKRSHGAIPLRCKLPSGDDFIVPSNLYILGAMNTADKSISLLDIALRRRFEFEAMYPLYEINGVEINSASVLRNINSNIKARKGADFQIGHAYFMGDNFDLIATMNKKVIPLLLEYFMNDEKEVKEILQKAGLNVDAENWPLKVS